MVMRREGVGISATDDGFTTTLAKLTAATMLLESALDAIDGRQVASAKTAKELGSAQRSLAKDLDRTGSSGGNAASGLDKGTASARDQGREIDRLSGRLRLYTDLALGIGPALIPIGAVGGPAVASLTALLASGAAGALSLVVALQGVGDATKAIDAYELDPTVENLQKVQETMSALPKAGQAIALAYQDLQPTLASIQQAAANGAAPGIIETLENVNDLAPQARDFLREVGDAAGDAAADSTASLASDRWRDVIDYFTAEAPEKLTELTGIVGDLGHGLGELLISLDPGSDSATDWITDVADGFDRWASSEKGREDVEAFLDYARENGPEVEDFFVSLIDTAAQITQAAAPLGGPVLSSLTKVLDVVGNIADSDLGTPLFTAAAGLSVYNRALAVTSRLQASTAAGSTGVGGFIGGQAGKVKAGAAALLTVTSAQDRARMSSAQLAEAEAKKSAAIRGGLATIGKATVAAGGLALATSGLADDFGLSNTASMTMLGTLGGPWGAGIGAGVGLVMDFRAANEDLTASIKDAYSAAEAGDFDALRESARAAQDEISGGYDPENWLGFSQQLAKNKARDIGAALGIVKDSTSEAQDELNRLDAIASRGEWVGMLSGIVDDSDIGEIRGVGDAVAALGDDAIRTADSADQLATALDALLGPNLDLSQATDDWTRSLRTLDQDLAKHSRALTGNTTGALTNRDAIRSRVGELSQMLQLEADAGAGPAKLANTLQRQKKALLDSAEAAGLNRGQTARMIAQMGLTPKLVRTVFKAAEADRVASQVKALRKTYDGLPPKVQSLIRAEGIPKAKSDAAALARQYNLTPREKKTLMQMVDQASGKTKAVQELLRIVGAMRPKPLASLIDQITPGVSRAQAAINSLHGKSVTVTTYYREVRSGVSAAKSAQGLGHAEGGLITGPGGPREDRIPAMLSNGEYVVNAAATREHLALLHEINARRYADGGFATHARTPVVAARPLYAAPQPIRATAGGTGVMVRERVVERLAGRVTIDIGGGQQLVGVIRSEAAAVAEGVLAADHQFDIDHMGG